MLYGYSFSSTEISLFVLTALTTNLATAFFFTFLYFRRRFLFAKSSIQLLLVLHLLVQWPFALYSGYYQQWLPRPWEFAALIYVTISVALLISTFSFNQTALLVWKRIGAVPSADQFAAVVALALLCFALSAVYFLYVPFDCTGLHAMLFDPTNLALAREMSVKLLTDPIPRYAISLLQAAAVPLATATIFSAIYTSRRPSTWLIGVALIVMLWMLALLPGVKSTMLSLVIVVALTIFWTKKLQLNPLHIPLIVALALAPVVLLTFAISITPQRAGSTVGPCFGKVELTLPTTKEEVAKSFNPQIDLGSAQPSTSAEIRDEPSPAPDQAAPASGRNFLLQLEQIAYRAAVIPLEVGGWYVHHQQTNGRFGIEGIPKLASLVGATPINVPNVIGLKYGPVYYGHPVAPTISASSGFVFAFYAYFGAWAIPLLIACILFLDVALIALRYINHALVVPMMAALSLSTLKFVESDYTTVWLTHGFGVVLALGLAVSGMLSIMARVFKRARE